MAKISASFTRGRFKVVQYRPGIPPPDWEDCLKAFDKRATDCSILSVAVITTHYSIQDSNHVIAVTGSTERLGDWEPSRAIRMTQVGNSGLWKVRIPLPHNKVIQWKLVVLDKNSFCVIRWEERANRIMKLFAPVEFIAPWNCAEIIRKSSNGGRRCNVAGNWNESGNRERRIKRKRENERDTESKSEYGEHSGDSADSDKDDTVAPIKYMTAVTDAMNSDFDQPGPSSRKDYDTYLKRETSVCQVATVDCLRWNFQSEIISLVDGNVEDMLYSCASVGDLAEDGSGNDICIGKSNESLHIYSEEHKETNSDLNGRGIVGQRESNSNVSEKEISYTPCTSESADKGSKTKAANDKVLDLNNASKTLFETDIYGVMDRGPYGITVPKLNTEKLYEQDNASADMYDTDDIMEYEEQAVSLFTIDTCIANGNCLASTSNQPWSESEELFVLESDVDYGIIYRIPIDLTEIETDKLATEIDGQIAKVVIGTDSTVKDRKMLRCKFMIGGGALVVVIAVGVGFLYYKFRIKK